MTPLALFAGLAWAGQPQLELALGVPLNAPSSRASFSVGGGVSVPIRDALVVRVLGARHLQTAAYWDPESQEQVSHPDLGAQYGTLLEQASIVLSVQPFVAQANGWSLRGGAGVGFGAIRTQDFTLGVEGGPGAIEWRQTSNVEFVMAAHRGAWGVRVRMASAQHVERFGATETLVVTVNECGLALVVTPGALEDQRSAP